jgi:hypothetical protein
MSLFAFLSFAENQNFLNFPQGRFLSSFPQSSRNGFFPVPRQQSQSQQQPNPPGSYQQQDVYLDGPTNSPYFSSFQSFGGVSTKKLSINLIIFNKHVKCALESRHKKPNSKLE